MPSDGAYPEMIWCCGCGTVGLWGNRLKCGLGAIFEEEEEFAWSWIAQKHNVRCFTGPHAGFVGLALWLLLGSVWLAGGLFFSLLMCFLTSGNGRHDVSNGLVKGSMRTVIGQMVLDDHECMRGPTWSVALLGVDAGFAYNVWWNEWILYLTIGTKQLLPFVKEQYDVTHKCGGVE